MTDPTAEEFQTWCEEHAELAEAVRQTQAHARAEKERVDAYILPIFARYEFYNDASRSTTAYTQGERITNPEYLYLSNDGKQAARYYTECDRAYRAHGFTGPKGYCPELAAEELQHRAEEILIRSGCLFLDIDISHIYGAAHEKMLSLLIRACLLSKQG